MQYGVFVDCDDFHGLLHRNALSVDTSPKSFQMGQPVRVEVLALEENGAALRLIAPSES